jgi:hypothetical protein
MSYSYTLKRASSCDILIREKMRVFVACSGGYFICVGRAYSKMLHYIDDFFMIDDSDCIIEYEKNQNAK